MGYKEKVQAYKGGDNSCRYFQEKKIVDLEHTTNKIAEQKKWIDIHVLAFTIFFIWTAIYIYI